MKNPLDFPPDDQRVIEDLAAHATHRAVEAMLDAVATPPTRLAGAVAFVAMTSLSTATVEVTHAHGLSWPKRLRWRLRRGG